MRKHFLFHLLTVVVTLLLAGCSEKEKEILVESIALSQPSAEMEIGETLTLKATVSPSNASYDGLYWTSTNPKIASVSTSGLVTAISEGNTTITVMAGGRTSSCVITVVKGFVAVTSISLNKTSLEMVEGDSEMLVATVLPDDASDKSVIWSSSNADIATVNDGLVTAIKAGEATITANAGNKSVTCKVVVSKKIIAVESVELNQSIISLDLGKTATLIATILPANATNKDVTWSSSDTSIASVNSAGVVTGKDEGSAKITVTTTDGSKTATCLVKVVSPRNTETINDGNDYTWN